MKMNPYYILLILVPTIFWGQSTYQSRRAAHDKKYLKTFEYSRLGFKFRYDSDFEDIPEQFDVDTTSWKYISLKRYRIIFKSPKPYSMHIEPGRFFGGCGDPIDSVTKLNYGGGIKVNIYETKFNFNEIAFAEGFYLYNEDDGFYTQDKNYTIPKVVDDSAWVTDYCGVPFGVQNLNGYFWKGLRGRECYSETLPMEMGGSPAYGNHYVHLFVVHPTSYGTILVFDFSNEPDSKDQREERLDEIMFYELISSVKMEYSKNKKLK